MTFCPAATRPCTWVAATRNDPGLRGAGVWTGVAVGGAEGIGTGGGVVTVVHCCAPFVDVQEVVELWQLAPTPCTVHVAPAEEHAEPIPFAVHSPAPLRHTAPVPVALQLDPTVLQVAPVPDAVHA